MSKPLVEQQEHQTLTDAARPHCRCGWIPRTGGPRALIAVNVHVSKGNRSARCGENEVEAPARANDLDPLGGVVPGVCGGPPEEDHG